MGEPSFKRLLCVLVFAGWGALSLSGVTIEPDPRKIDPALPLSAQAADHAARMGAFPAVPRTVVPQVPAFIALRSGDPELTGKLGNLGGTARRITDRLFVAHVPPDAVRYVSRWEAVSYIEAAKAARPLLDESRVETSATVVQAGAAPLPQAFTGAGVNVGIVDTGLDGTHLDFFDSGGTATRVAHTHTAPSFAPGISPNPLIDEDGHGTHVTGIAAGNGLLSSGLYTGMAPGAGILVGKTNFFTTDIVTAVTNLMNDSAVGGEAFAVNLSLGVSIGPHDGTDTQQGSLFTQAIHNLATNPPGGKGIIVVAAGNGGDRGEHFQAVIPSFETATAFVDDLLATSAIPLIDVDAWADGQDRYDVTVTLSGSGEALAVPSGTAGTHSSGRISVSNRVDAPLNGATHIFISVRPPAGTATARIDFMRTRNGGSGKVDAYTTSDVIGGVVRNHFRDAAPFGTVTEPANAENVIAVGSFNTKPNGGAGTVGGISSFSSLGPTRDGRIKPDVAAPGSLIYSARSQEASFIPIEIVEDNDNYAIMQGTSMASPHVAGIAALVWESNPNLTGAQMRERLRRTAEPVLEGGVSPNTTWGSGRVDALRAVVETVAGITVVPPPGASGGPIPPSAAVTLRGDEKSSGPFGGSISYTWAEDGGGLLTSTAGPETEFSADAPGEYPVTLIVSPGSAPYNSAAAIVRVNTIPDAAISGPAASDNVGAPVTFNGAESSDPDGQPLAYRWVLVTRPAGSSATLSEDAEDVTLVPDVAGAYEIGLRVDDGLDNSALAIRSFTAGAVAVSSSRGGGGGCSVVGTGGDADLPSAAAALLLFIVPVAALGARSRAALRARRGP